MILPRIRAKIWLNLTDTDPIEADVVNPGEWFGGQRMPGHKPILLQMAIANALNPFFLIEADHDSDAIAYWADSDEYSHLIDVAEEDCPKTEEEENDSDYTRAGNDGHFVDLSNVAFCSYYKLECYFIEIPDHTDTSLVSDLEEVLVKYRKEKREEADESS